jgi:alkylation response protein AidB-like acyl-CoA dehydrogenase
MSETEAGSDLGSLQTRAIEDRDDYVINGQKTWTSGGSFVNYFYLLARTDPEAPKHRGISEFIIPADVPGITRIPMIDITGTEAWNDVFLTGHVFPRNASLGRKTAVSFRPFTSLIMREAGWNDSWATIPSLQPLCSLPKRINCLRNL